MSDNRCISLRDFSTEFGMKGQKLFEAYSLPIVVKATKQTKALYDYDLMVVIYNQFIEKYIKPHVLEVLKSQDVVFKSCEMYEPKIKEILAERKLTGNKELYSDVVFVIHKESERIAKEYNLVGKDHFAKELVEKDQIHKMTALHRINSAIKESGLKPVAYSKKVTAVYDPVELNEVYQAWLEKHARK